MRRRLFFLVLIPSLLAAADPAREIDALLAQDREKHGARPNPPASDETFVRRVYLDLSAFIVPPRFNQRFT